MADRSFALTDSSVVTLPAGQIAHHDHVAQSVILKRELHEVTTGVWCLVGNGLSNQTFVDAPAGIIAIDTGESHEEMAAAIAELRTVSDRPIVAVIYTHFHYVSGTTAAFDDAGVALPVYGHAGIAANRQRVSSLVGPTYGRGLVQQFAINLPQSGPDGVVNVGLGRFFRDPAHAPFTNGFVAPDHTFTDRCAMDVAGLDVQFIPAPSDSDDSAHVWFPSLKVCVQNIAWPTLFNIFAIRGETYRDPLVLLQGFDDLLDLEPDYLVATHGPPMFGSAQIRERVTKQRDSIQFLWDQTVRRMNQGWTNDQIAAGLRLPAHCDRDFLTAERYGVAEHHVRQIASGVRGWFDGDTTKLFPLPPAERSRKLINGFGGREAVIEHIEAAVASNDLRWACELATWLTQTANATSEDSSRLAGILRTIGQRSPAANIRNWCLTAARDLEGVAPLEKYRTHRLRRADVLRDPIAAAETLRVLFNPDRAGDLEYHVHIRLTDTGTNFGLFVRNGVLVVTAGTNAHGTVSLTSPQWADLLCGVVHPTELVQGLPAQIMSCLDCVAEL